MGKVKIGCGPAMVVCVGKTLWEARVDSQSSLEAVCMACVCNPVTQEAEARASGP